MLKARWSGKGYEDAYDLFPNLSKIKDESDNNNTAYGFNVSKLYLGQMEDDKGVIGTSLSFQDKNIEVSDHSALGFNGHSFMRVGNSDSINLDRFTIKIRFYTYQKNISQYILDKRNGQWHRNYCMLYAGKNFPHFREGMEDKNWMLFDFGDKREMIDDFDNGIYFELEDQVVISYDKWIDLDLVYDGTNLIFWMNDQIMASKKVDMNDIKGDGDLIIGDAAWPHTYESWPVYGSHPFFGAIDYIEIYDSIEKEYER